MGAPIGNQNARGPHKRTGAYGGSHAWRNRKEDAFTLSDGRTMYVERANKPAYQKATRIVKAKKARKTWGWKPKHGITVRKSYKG